MQQIAAFACRCLYRLRVWQTLLALEAAVGWRRQIVVLLYHHIRPDDDGSQPLSQVEEGVKLSTFENQVREFRRWYQPMNSEQVDAAINEKIGLSSDAMLVTFDDGYQDNRTLAGPVLRKHRIPAIIFLSTGYIETSKRFWWVRLNDAIRSLSSESLNPAVENLARWPDVADLLARASVADHCGRRQLRVPLAQILETKTGQEKKEILDALQVVADDCSATCLPILGWEGIRNMHGEGFEFGAHTVTHPRLTQIPAEQAQQEMVDSAQAIAEQTGQRPAAIAYPYGDYNGYVEQTAQQAGFSVAYTADPGVVVPGRTSPTRVPRMQLHASKRANLVLLIVVLKLGKYMSRLARLILLRYFGESFEI